MYIVLTYSLAKLAFHAYTICAQLNIITDLVDLHEAACACTQHILAKHMKIRFFYSTYIQHIDSVRFKLWNVAASCAEAFNIFGFFLSGGALRADLLIVL